MNKPGYMRRYGRFFLLGVIGALVGLFFVAGLHRYLSLEWIKAQLSLLQELAEQRPIFTITAYAAVYIPAVAFNLPGAVVLGLAAGALFGTLTGTVVVSFASSIGATLSCLISRYLLRDMVRRRFAEKLKLVNAGIREEGAFYLFALRLMPIIPFFLINMVMGLTSMPLRTFYLVSQLGMLPGTAIFVHAGSRLGRIDTLAGLLSPGVVLSLSLLGIFPLAARRGIDFFRRRNRQDRASSRPVRLSGGLLDQCLEAIREKCSACGLCQESCAFLSKYGNPGQIAKNFAPSSFSLQEIAYECSLCGLCAEVCPVPLDPGRLFLEARRRAVAEGNFNPSPYRAILRYEKLGVSPLLTWYGLPEGCDTVFFPGCSLPGTRPAVTLEMFQQLRKHVPSLGMVLDCCAKPSHDLGRTERFQNLFAELNDYLADHGIRTVLTACPSCTQVFRQYGRGIEVCTVYDFLHAKGFAARDRQHRMPVAVHDPCALRNDTAAHRAVRSLLSGSGYTLVEMEHRHQRTLCCGEGGTVGAVNHDLAKAWAARLGRQAAGDLLVSYCAGCVASLNRVYPTVHIADLLYRGEAARQGKLKVARAPFTYLNRILLKIHLKREIRTAIQRVRPPVGRREPLSLPAETRPSCRFDSE